MLGLGAQKMPAQNQQRGPMAPNHEIHNRCVYTSTFDYRKCSNKWSSCLFIFKGKQRAKKC